MDRERKGQQPGTNQIAQMIDNVWRGIAPCVPAKARKDDNCAGKSRKIGEGVDCHDEAPCPCNAANRSKKLGKLVAIGDTSSTVTGTLDTIAATTRLIAIR